MATIPRAELNAVLERYDDEWAGTGDFAVEVVRRAAADFRRFAAAPIDSEDPARDLAEADDLDALADRYEREGN
jgi:hypothetical protein